jgi:hypothetical protein
MRKQSHSIPPALKRDSRLINSVGCKRPNALKHGVFSDAALIPGEDSREYKQLLAELMDEWQPAGPTLRDEVVEFADLKWKRRRLRKFIQTKLIAGMFDPRSPAFNEAWGLANFAYRLSTKPETCFEQHASTYLRADKIKHLKERFPRPNYQSTSEWVEAVRKEIFSVLIPDMSEFDSPEPGKEAEEMMEALRQWKDDCQVAATIMQASELLEYELKQGELLEARIARKIKFLVELKTMEQMLGKS